MLKDIVSLIPLILTVVLMLVIWLGTAHLLAKVVFKTTLDLASEGDGAWRGAICGIVGMLVAAAVIGICRKLFDY